MTDNRRRIDSPPTEAVSDYKPKHDFVNHPPHYTGNPGGIEPVNVVEMFGLSGHLEQAVIYLLRHKEKGGVEDLRKSIWWIAREIKLVYGERVGEINIDKELDYLYLRYVDEGQEGGQ